MSEYNEKYLDLVYIFFFTNLLENEKKVPTAGL